MLLRRGDFWVGSKLSVTLQNTRLDGLLVLEAQFARPDGAEWPILASFPTLKRGTLKPLRLRRGRRAAVEIERFHSSRFNTKHIGCRISAELIREML